MCGRLCSCGCLCSTARLKKKCTKCFILTGDDEKTFIASLRRNSAEQSTLNHGICVKMNYFYTPPGWAEERGHELLNGAALLRGKAAEVDPTVIPHVPHVCLDPASQTFSPQISCLLYWTWKHLVPGMCKCLPLLCVTTSMWNSTAHEHHALPMKWAPQWKPSPGLQLMFQSTFCARLDSDGRGPEDACGDSLHVKAWRGLYWTKQMLTWTRADGSAALLRFVTDMEMLPSPPSLTVLVGNTFTRVKGYHRKPLGIPAANVTPLALWR